MMAADASPSSTSKIRFAVMKFDDRNRFGKNGVPAVLLFSGGGRVVVHMKEETLEKAGKRNRFAKVVLDGDELDPTNETARQEAQLIELLGEVGTYAGELEAYQLHFGIKPCRYPKDRHWALTPIAEPCERGRIDCSRLHVFSVDNVGTRDIDDALSLTPLSEAPAALAASIDSGAGLEMFTSGSAPMACDMITGGGTQMFTTSCAPVGTQAALGERVEMFTTSC